jgi:hypothetical protein
MSELARAVPHHRANGGQCLLAAREELIFAAPPCTAGWYLQRFTRFVVV